MLRSRNKLTGEQGRQKPAVEGNVPEPTEGDCRECAFYTPPHSTGHSEDLLYITDNWRMRPCGQGACVGKKFMTRDELKKMQETSKEKPTPAAPKKKAPPRKKADPAKKKGPEQKTGLLAGGGNGDK